MTVRRLIALVGAVLAAVVIFVAGVVVGGHAEALRLTELSNPVRGWLLGDSGRDLSSQVLDLLQRDYYKPVDADRLKQVSADALVAALHDPYTDYLSPAEVKEQQQAYEGAFFGVGVELTRTGKTYRIAHVESNGPASKAGIKDGDVLVSVDGVATSTLGFPELVEKVRGKEGTAVKLGVKTGDQPVRVLTLTRARFTQTSVFSRMETSGGVKVGYIYLEHFNDGVGDQVRATVTRLRGKGAAALVLDLRGDGGGLVREALKVASAFLPDGSAVVTTSGAHSDTRTLRTSGDPVAGDLPLIVLVDRNSASASEIVSGALRDSKRGELVGERTFGKALVQSTIPLRNGGALKLTTQRYLTPSGFDLAHRGLPPAVHVVDDPHTPQVDVALQKALALAAAKTRG
jgi:carboxyl-terminal processing protease